MKRHTPPGHPRRGARFTSARGFSLLELMAAVGVFAVLVGIATAVTVNQRSSAEESALKSDMVAAATALESWLLSVNGRPEVELAIATATDGWAASTFSETVLSGPVAPGSTLTGRVTAGNGLYCFVGTRGDFSFVMSSLDPRPVEGTSCDAVLGTAPDGADAGLPAAPGTVSATAGPNVGDVAVTWQGTVGALEYSVTVPGQAAALVSAPAITTTLTGIPAGTHYVTVRARNDVGWGPRTTSNRITIGAEAPPSGTPSGEATPGPTQDRPAAPTDLTAASDPSSLSVALTWNAPVDDGGSPIIDYIVQYRSTPSGSWRNFTDGAATATTATVTDLALNDVAYEFRVRAVNAIGNGTWSNVATTGTLSFQGAPTGLVATAGNQQVSLSWNAVNGGLPITDYVIEYRTTDGPGEWQVVEDGTSTVTTATVTGLTNSTSYDFRVSAVRNAGPGDASNIATATPQPDPPAAPSALAGTPGNQQVSLSWDAPLNEGGSPVSDYLIQYRTTPSGPWTVFEDATSTATSVVVTGLTNGTAYDFRVAAVNSAGTGDYSTPLLNQTPFTVASAPTGDTGLLMFHRNNPGPPSAVTPVGFGAKDACHRDAIGTLNVTWPTGGPGGTCTAGAFSTYGYGTLVAPVTGTVTFTAVHDDAFRLDINGSTIIDNWTEQDADPAGNSTGTLAVTANQVYAVSVWTHHTQPDATVRLTWQYDSMTSPVLVPLGVPTASGTGTSGELALAWSPPASNGGLPVTGYEYRVSSNGGTTWTVNGTTTGTRTTVTGLIDKTAHVFQVRAVTAAGPSDWSRTSTPGTPHETLAITFPNTVLTPGSNRQTLVPQVTGGFTAASPNNTVKYSGLTGQLPPDMTLSVSDANGVLTGPAAATWPGVGTITRLAASTTTLCAQTSDGVYCAGANPSTGRKITNRTGATTTYWVPIMDERVPANYSSHGYGAGHGCAITPATGVQCWGQGTAGQLGNGTILTSNAIVDVIDGATGQPLTGATSLSAGSTHNCVIMTDTTVKCWGANASGQLGNGESGTGKLASTAVTVLTAVGGPALTGVVEVSAGVSHTCARLDTGTAKCWGINSGRQLGDNSTTLRATPVDVRTSATDAAPLPGVRRIIASSSHTCAIVDTAQATGVVKCWGAGSNGRLGRGSTTNFAVPVDVYTSATDTTPLSGVRDLSSLDSSTCVVTADRGVKCWGLNTSAQLGAADLNFALESWTPVDVAGVSNARQVVSGTAFHCALLTDGVVKCWGLNTSGQLASAAAATATSRLPKPVSGLASITDLAVGTNHTCAVLPDRTVKCWGTNAAWQLGLGSLLPLSTATPTTVPGLANVRSVHAGATASCAIVDVDATTHVRCWGTTTSGQLGTGGTGVGGNTAPGATALTTVPQPVVETVAGGAPFTGATEVTGGVTFFCALRPTDGGTVWCWGLGTSGQLGNGASLTSTVPKQVVTSDGPLTGVVDITSHHTNGHTCAVRNDGTTWCWGANSAVGQLGDGTTTVKNIAVQVVGVTDAIQVEAHTNGYCVLLRNTTVACWGEGSTGELGNGTADSLTIKPVLTATGGPPLTGVSDLNSGNVYHCAELVDGSSRCWGSTGVTPYTVTGLRPIPSRIPALDQSLQQVDSGSAFGCAMMGQPPNTTAHCWGATAQSTHGMEVRLVETSPVLWGVPNLPFEAPVAVTDASGIAIATPVITSAPQIVAGLNGTPAESAGAVTLTWPAPRDNGSPITGYVGRYRESPAGAWTDFDPGSSGTVTVTDLTPGVAYDFQIAAVNANGTGAYGGSVTVIATGGAPTPQATAPGVPAALAGTPGDQQVSVTWDAPADDGGSPVTDYVVQYRAGPTQAWATFNEDVSTATSAVVTELTNGTAYDFQVAAVNTAGAGPWSATTTATPSAPLSLSGYSTVQLVTGVAMSAQTPTVSGGLGSNTYTVNPPLPNGLTLDTSTGAISGTPTVAQAATVHTVTVTDATSGQTATATISVAVQPPMNFTTGYSDASLVTGAVMVTQTPQVANGYGTKTYSISPVVPAGLSFDTSTGALSGTPTDPQDQTLYTVTVTDSAAPEPFTATDPVRLDVMVAHPAPTGLTASTGVSRQMDLTWNAVAGADSTSLRQYTVRYRTSAGAGPWITATDTVQERPWTPADLSTGAALWLDANDASSFTITDGRVEEWRDRSGNNRHVRQNTPSARPVREANLVNGKAAVRWDGSYRSLRTTTNLTLNDFDLFVVFRDTGAQNFERLVDHDYVSGFWLGRDNTNVNSWRSGVREPTAPYGRAVNLPDGQWHLIQSGRAGNQHTIRGNGGNGVTGTVDGTATANGPLALGGYANGTSDQSLMNGDIAEVILVPAALGVEDRQRLEGYLAHRWGTTASLPADHPFRTTVPTAVSGFTATVTGLVNGTGYDFQVAATSPAGTGAYAAVSATPLSPPGAPETLTATPGDRQVSLSWQPPTDTGGNPVLDYRVEYRTSPNGLWIPTTTTLTSLVITGLVNGTVYDFRVAARNTTGTGADASATETPRTVPGYPTNLAATAGGSEVTLNWGAPTNSGGSPVTGYAIQYATAGSQAWTTLMPGMIPVTAQPQPWTPANLSTGAALWLDANDASSFTITDGRVEEWRDRSGNNRHVRQNTPSARPVREANLVNGKAAVRWDGSYRSLRTTTNLTLNDFDLFVVFRDTGAQTYERLVDHDFANGFWLGRDNATVNSWRSGVREPTAPHGRTVNLPDGQWHLIQSGRAGTQHTIRGNGGTGVTGTVSSVATTNAPVGIGSWFNGSTGQSLVNGDIAEVILVPAALGVEDRQRLEGYLAHRWGTTASLPADHPFRTTVPTAVSGFTATVTGLVNGTGYDFQVAAVNSVGTGAYSSPVVVTTGGAPSTFDPSASGELAGALLLGK